MSTISALADSYVGTAVTSSVTQSSGSDLGRDQFLHLLTVQLMNQDPMSPMESQDFSAQIAQFSQVEQLEQMSDSMAQSNEIDLMLTQAITNTMSTTLVGKRAKVAGDKVMITSEGDAEVYFKLGRSAANIKISVYDEAGNKVKTIEKTGMVEGNQTVDWDGTDDDGEKLSKDEQYTFTVEATDSDGNDIEVSTYMMGIIQGVEYSDNSTMLILNTGQTAAFSSVLEIKAPEDY